mmetsp:Transcript_28429/g.55663  ORF Transcript_28429/g.55663 Transcript_28429/m.55663 type:complete len:167 (+) Transcript_28429:109-609(+)
MPDSGGLEKRSAEIAGIALVSGFALGYVFANAFKGKVPKRLQPTGGSQTAILLVDHGSKRPKANDMVFDVAEMLRSIRPDVHFEACHMEIAEPGIPTGLQRCVETGATRIVVFPYMLSPGRHATTDIPQMVEEAQQKVAKHVEVSVAPCLGIHENIGKVILERAGV